MEPGGVGDQEDVAVDVCGGADWPEVQGEDVAGLLRGDQDGLAEVLHLDNTRSNVDLYVRPPFRERFITVSQSSSLGS